MKFKGLLKVALLLVAVSALFVACDTLAGGKFPVMFEPYEPEEGYIYLKPNANWLEKDGSDVAPRFAVYTAPKDWSSADWYDMEETEKDSGIYKVKLPADKKYYWVIFARMNGSKTENNWDAKYNQSKDEVLVYADDDASNDKKVLYIVADGSWDKSSDSFWHNPEEYVGNIVKYTVTFTADSGVTGVPEKQEVKENTQITAPAEPSKDGYIFEGWYDGDTKITFPYTVTKDVTLKAKFKEMPKDITDVVYSYTVPLAKLGSWSKPDVAKVGILVMSDEQVAAGTVSKGMQKAANVFIYTHAAGNFKLNGTFGDWGDNVDYEIYATVTSTDITVYYKLPKEDVTAGKKAYVIGLIDKANAGTDYVFSPDGWGADVVKMKAEGTIPTNPVKNEKPVLLNCGLVHTPEEDTIYVYCKDGFLSGSDDEKIVAYFMGDENAFVTMSLIDGYGNKLFKVAIPEDKNYTGVIIVRMDKTKENSWAASWNQTGDLTLPTDDKVCFVVDSWEQKDLTDDDWLPFATE